VLNLNRYPIATLCTLAVNGSQSMSIYLTLNAYGNNATGGNNCAEPYLMESTKLNVQPKLKAQVWYAANTWL
jgi:hypothetical protein